MKTEKTDSAYNKSNSAADTKGENECEARLHAPASVDVEGRLSFHIFIAFMCENAGKIDCRRSKSIQLLGA